MIFHQQFWISTLFDKNFDFVWTMAIGLLLVASAQSFPQQRSKNTENQLKYSSSTANTIASDVQRIGLETLNSKISSVNVKSDIEKPVFDNNDYDVKRNVESAKSVTNQLSETARQMKVPFIAVPANWLATFQPSNAVIIAQKAPLRIWAIGSISRFPAFLERFVQRVQSYYSTYKYPDLSRPASLAIINPQYHQYDTSDGIDSTGSGSDGFDSVESDSTEGVDVNESTESDVIENDSVESDTYKYESNEDDTQTTNTDYYDTTTDPNYSDEDEDNKIKRKCNGSTSDYQ